jgi:formylmethanofuran dehydrogenase subunit B
MTEQARAWLNGQPVHPARATAAAASLLAASRSAVVAGLGTDVAGVRASVALARAIGGSIDHMEAEAVFANLDVLRRAGWIVTTPLQTRARADTVLLVGDGLAEAWPDMADRLALGEAPKVTGGSRRVVHLGPSSSPLTSWPGVSGPPLPARAAAGGPDKPGHDDRGGASLAIATGKPVLPTLAALRAIVSGRKTSLDEAAAAPLRDLAASLAAARFGVAVWSSATLDTLAVEMLCGLIDDLNKTTRFAGLPLAAANGAEAAAQALTWITGFPPRTGFAASAPQHDPWRFDAQRLIGSGEADAAVWISAFSPRPPDWDNTVPTIALVPAGTAFRTPPNVVLEVGCPGHDHDAMLFDPALGGIAFAAASAPSDAASVAATLAAITAALPPC